MKESPHIPDSRCLALEVILPALVVVVMLMVMETQRGRRVGRVGLVVVVRVRAGGEAAGAGWCATVVRDGTGPGAGARSLEEGTLGLAKTRTSQGGAEVTVLAAQHGRGRGVRARGVAFARPLGVRDGCRRGNSSAGRG